MTKLSKIILIFAFLVVFSSFVCAINESEGLPPFEVSVEPIKDRIDFEENARFKITIKNPRESIETFIVKPSAPYVEWFIKTDPTSDYSSKAYPNSDREVFVIVKPLSVGLGRYALRLNVKHIKSRETFKKDIIVNVISMSNLPAVSISGKVPEKVDPREPFNVEVWLENRNSKELKDITVELRSDAIRDSTVTTLGALGSGDDKKTLDFSIKLDKKTPAIKDSLKIVVSVDDGEDVFELKSAPYDYEILKYGGVVDQHNKKLRFLASYDEISFVNDANTKFEGYAKLESPFYKALFTKAQPKPTSFVEDGKRYMGWTVDLKAQESFDVIVRINYLPFFIVVLVLGFLIFSYFSFRSPVIITKTIKDIIKREGGITYFKVLLEIKNRSNETLENVSIIDRIPDIADFEKEENLGTLQPVKVVHTKRGIIGKWVIETLDKDEETLIKYNVKSRLSILGKMPLPVAFSKFKDKKNRIKRSYSNKIIINS